MILNIFQKDDDQENDKANEKAEEFTAEQIRQLYSQSVPSAPQLRQITGQPTLNIRMVLRNIIARQPSAEMDRQNPFSKSWMVNLLDHVAKKRIQKLLPIPWTHL